MNSNILTDIRNQADKLSKSERMVAEWLLANGRRAVDQSIGEVAEAAGVSEPTVIRFCRSIGLSGFRQLRTHLIAAQQKPQSYLHNDVSRDDVAEDAAMKVLENSIHALVELRESLSQMPFETAVQCLRDARLITFVGLGASGCVARDANHKFFRLGVPCTATLDSQTILQHAAVATTADVYIAISHTGNWPELIKGMQLAQKRGATVIAVTDQSSDLAQTADLTFHCHPPEDTNTFTPMSSRLAQLTVLDAIQVCLAISLGEVAEENLRLTNDALISHLNR